MGFSEEWERDVVNGYASGGGGSGSAVVGVAVEDDVYFKAIDGVFEAAAAKKGKKFGRFAFDGAFNRGVVKEGHTLRGVEAAESALEAEGLIYRFLDECLDEGFAPWIQHELAKAATETADSCETDSIHFGGFAIEDLDTGFLQHIGDVGGMPGLKVMVSQDGEDGNGGVGTEILGEDLCFLDVAVISQVSAEHKDIGDFRGFSKERLKVSF